MIKLNNTDVRMRQVSGDTTSMGGDMPTSLSVTRRRYEIAADDTRIAYELAKYSDAFFFLEIAEALEDNLSKRDDKFIPIDLSYIRKAIHC